MATTIADAIPLFLESMEGRGLSEGTLKRHHGALVGGTGRRTSASFLESAQSLKGPGVTLGQVDHQVVARYMSSTTGAQGNRNNRLESVRLFLKWAERGRLLRPGLRAEDILDGY